MDTAEIENRTVTIGDVVSFKSDIEQSGKIQSIRQDFMGYTELVLEALNPRGFQGEYIRGDMTTTQRASDCWLE